MAEQATRLRPQSDQRPTGVITGVTNATATATAVVNGGQVIGFNVTSHGAGYISAPTVTITGGGGTGAVAAASPTWSPS